MAQIVRLLFGILLLAAMLVAVSYALPGNVSVARATVINAPESDVFPYLNNLKRFNQWSPWAAKDPEMAYTFSGPVAGEGAKMSWKSSKLGSGSQEIVEIRQNSLVKMALDFGDMGVATANYRLTPEGAGTKVTWSFNTETGGNPVARWMGLFYDRWVGADYEEGLRRLKKVVEAGG